eukprot:SM000132S26909  [mRNA]  locus=s132:368556:370477:- [translate_table: standard]
MMQELQIILRLELLRELREQPAMAPTFLRRRPAGEQLLDEVADLLACPALRFHSEATMKAIADDILTPYVADLPDEIKELYNAMDWDQPQHLVEALQAPVDKLALVICESIPRLESSDPSHPVDQSSSRHDDDKRCQRLSDSDDGTQANSQTGNSSPQRGRSRGGSLGGSVRAWRMIEVARSQRRHHADDQSGRLSQALRLDGRSRLQGEQEQSGEHCGWEEVSTSASRQDPALLNRASRRRRPKRDRPLLLAATLRAEPKDTRCSESSRLQHAEAQRRMLQLGAHSRAQKLVKKIPSHLRTTLTKPPRQTTTGSGGGRHPANDEANDSPMVWPRPSARAGGLLLELGHQVAAQQGLQCLLQTNLVQNWKRNLHHKRSASTASAPKAWPLLEMEHVVERNEGDGFVALKQRSRELQRLLDDAGATAPAADNGQEPAAASAEEGLARSGALELEAMPMVAAQAAKPIFDRLLSIFEAYSADKQCCSAALAADYILPAY